MPDRMAFDGQVAIVTGAGSGIGRAIALELAGRGAQLVINDSGVDDTGRPLAARVVAEIEAAGGVAIAETSAVGSRQAAEAIAAAAFDRFGRIDVLVNNAGIGRAAPFAGGSDDDVSAVIDVNLLGSHHLIRAVWPMMVARRYGRILNMSSSGAFGTGTGGAYASSKAGVIGLTKEAGINGAADGILVNALMPIAHTPLLMRHPEPAFRSWAEEHFPARLIAAVCAYLVSADLRETGEIFASGGGLVRRVVFYESEGFLDRALTAESMRDNMGQIMRLDGGETITGQADHNRLILHHFPRST